MVTHCKCLCLFSGEIQGALRRTTERLKTLAKQFQSVSLSAAGTPSRFCIDAKITETTAKLNFVILCETLEHWTT